jgi:uncharacterized damage-inducible protein DinB
MAIKDALLPEFDYEMAITRKVLARVEMADRHWRPHPKSMSMGMLASHICDIPSWVPAILERDAYEMSADGEETVPTAKHTSVEALLEEFDENVRQARALLDAASDAQLMQPWSLRQGDEEVLTMPKASVIRTFLFNHGIHHRGQLSVYLRLRDLPVPSIYGPSADESA